MSNVLLKLVCFSDITINGHVRNLGTIAVREATGLRNHLFCKIILYIYIFHTTIVWLDNAYS